jgi:hypothetical protein
VAEIAAKFLFLSSVATFEHLVRVNQRRQKYEFGRGARVAMKSGTISPTIVSTAGYVPRLSKANVRPEVLAAVKMWMLV